MIERRRRFCGRDFLLGILIALISFYIIVPSAALFSRGRPSLPKRIGLQFVRANHVLHTTAQDSRKDPYLSMPAEPLITTYLEMRSADQLRPKRADPQFQVREKTERDWRFNRDLYFRVGEQWDWIDKRSWTDEHWKEYATAPELWTFAGYYDDVSLVIMNCVGIADGGIEIAYFGLLPELIGRGLGGALLTSAIEGAWRIERNPSRVWVHTCNRDHPQALANYQARGMVVYKIEEEP